MPQRASSTRIASRFACIRPGAMPRIQVVGAELDDGEVGPGDSRRQHYALSRASPTGAGVARHARVDHAARLDAAAQQRLARWRGKRLGTAARP